jgi:hypothetical protein
VLNVKNFDVSKSEVYTVINEAGSIVSKPIFFEDREEK